ncbi:MAG: hypothetical protein KAH25_08610 [Bacteroidales bacterium]|nr:hypothetical protein [Bacteroidales bacterium]
MNLSFLRETVFIIILLTFSNAYSSISKSDSLNLILSETENDSIKIYTLIELSILERKTNLTNSIHLGKKALKLAELNTNPRYICYALCWECLFFTRPFNGSHNLLLSFYDIKKKENDSIGMALALSNIGGIKIYTEDYYEPKECILKAMEIYNKEYELDENSKYKLTQVYNLYNIGIFY